MALTLVLAAIAAFVAGVIQRITGLGFVLVLVGPIVLLYGPVEGVTIAVLLALVAALTAVPFVWKQVEWRRAWWLIWPGLIASPFGVLLVHVLPEAALLLVIAAMAYFALVASRIPALSASLSGRTGAIVAGSALMGMAGAFLTLSAFNAFFLNMINGRGWICVALVVFASWRPGKALLGALLFAFFDALQLRLQQAGDSVLPYQVYLMLPYLLSILALVLVARKASYPQALMKPYRKGER